MTRIKLVSVLLTGLIVATLACSAGSTERQAVDTPSVDAVAVSNVADRTTAVARPEQGHDHSGHSHQVQAVDPRIQADLPPMLLNVSFGPDGVSPSTLSIPLGREIQLVLRNRDVVEHHYHVQGLVPHYLLWLAKPGLVSDAGTSADGEEHAHHGNGELVEYHICTGSICPTGDAVHAHAKPGEMDIVSFVALDTGRFEVRDPLNPGITATVVVF